MRPVICASAWRASRRSSRTDAVLPRAELVVRAALFDVQRRRQLRVEARLRLRDLLAVDVLDRLRGLQRGLRVQHAEVGAGDAGAEVGLGGAHARVLGGDQRLGRIPAAQPAQVDEDLVQAVRRLVLAAVVAGVGFAQPARTTAAAAARGPGRRVPAARRARRGRRPARGRRRGPARRSRADPRPRPAGSSPRRAGLPRAPAAPRASKGWAVSWSG